MRQTIKSSRHWRGECERRRRAFVSATPGRARELSRRLWERAGERYLWELAGDVIREGNN